MALSMQIHFFRCLSKSVGCHQYVPNFKYFWIRSEGGGAEFSNISEIQEFLNYLREGGGQALMGIFPKCSLFFSDASHKYKYRIFQPYWPKNILYPKKTWPTSTNAHLDLNLLTPAGVSDIIGKRSPPPLNRIKFRQFLNWEHFDGSWPHSTEKLGPPPMGFHNYQIKPLSPTLDIVPNFTVF